MSVDYSFFTFKNTRFNYWPSIRFFIIVLFLLPPMVRFEFSFWKQLAKSVGDQKREEAEKKAAEEAEKKAAE